MNDPEAARRIVMVVGSMGIGGAERVAATMANFWVRSGRAVTLVSTYLGTRRSDYPLDKRVEHIFLGDTISPRMRVVIPRTLQKIFALRHVVRDRQPQAVISFLTNVNVLVTAALAGQSIPVIISERTDLAGSVELPLVLHLARFVLYRRADALVVQTEASARRIRKKLYCPRRAEVIGNPLPAALAASRVLRCASTVGGRVITMGRLTASKGFADLIEAFRMRFAGDPSWSLQIWGDGPLRGELERLVSDRGLHEQVQLCGVTPDPWSALSGADIFVLSSKYEGFPNAMLEAMALGLACVAFDCPSGPRELSDNGRAAWIVPAGDVEHLADAMRHVADDVQLRLRLGQTAAQFVRRSFADFAIMEKWDRLIQDIERKAARV